MNMTNPKILEAERIGMPEDKPERPIHCPTCNILIRPDTLRPCEAHKEKGERLCDHCEEVWIPEYNWHFCTHEAAEKYMVGIIQEQDDELFKLRKAAI